MKRETLLCMGALLRADPTINPRRRDEILEVCRRDSHRRRRRTGTTRQAAEILGVHPKTVRSYAKQGKFSVIRHSGRRTRYDLDEVQAFADNGTQNNGEEK